RGQTHNRKPALCDRKLLQKREIHLHLRRRCKITHLRRGSLLQSSAIFLSLLPAKGRVRESYNWAVYKEFSS
ncbi:MAG: hypothetical protein ABSF23_12540, partial [Terracidiphilus sp.]